MKQLNWKLMLSVAMVLAMSLTGAGCKTKKVKDTGEGTGNRTVEHTTGSGQPNIDQDSLLFGPSGLKAIYFDFDSSSVRADQVGTLKADADLLKQAPNAYIQVAGHCDERGTQEYNLALGERRALAVREYLIKLGISGDRVVTISYGEESPADPGHSEAAWAKNRRAEFNKASK